MKDDDDAQLQIRYIFNWKVLVFLFLHENFCCGYSLEVPHWGASNEYPKQVFFLSGEIRKRSVETHS